jgi:hypothetical protein
MAKSFETRVEALERICAGNGDACPGIFPLRQVVMELEEARLRAASGTGSTGCRPENPDLCQNDGAPGVW